MSSTRNPKPVEIIGLAADELTYIPTPEQRKAKSAFWTRFHENPLCEPADISLSLALQLAGDGRLSRWWSDPGFSEWFRNADEFRQRLEYLANLSLDTLEYVLVDPKAQSSAKVNAAKLLMEAARKMPSKGAVEKYLDEKIAEMDRKQLEEYISKKTRLLGVSNPLPTESGTNSVDRAEES